MNKRNILRVARAIEQAAKPKAKPLAGFNMAYFIDNGATLGDLSGHDCGTTCCIAGWARIVEEGKFSKRWSEHATAAKARAFLDLDGDQGSELFYGLNSPTLLQNIKPKQAVATLRHLAQTGEVNWRVA